MEVNITVMIFFVLAFSLSMDLAESSEDRPKRRPFREVSPPQKMGFSKLKAKVTNVLMN